MKNYELVELIRSIRNAVFSSQSNDKFEAESLGKCFQKVIQSDALFQKGEGEGSITTVGSGCTAKGKFSSSRGFHTRANADYSNTEGCECAIIDPHSSGSIDEWRDGMYAHSEGHLCESGGRCSHTEGDNTVTNNPSEHAEGQYNVSHYSDGSYYGDGKNTQHSVGIGINGLVRKNAFEIMQNGDVYVIGLGGYDGTNAGENGIKTLQQILASLGN